MVRLAGWILCAAVMVISASSLHAEREEPLVCCAENEDCDGGLCCPWAVVDDIPCAPTKTGYCKPVCVRNNTNN